MNDFEEQLLQLLHVQAAQTHKLIGVMEDLNEKIEELKEALEQ